MEIFTHIPPVGYSIIGIVIAIAFLRITTDIREVIRVKRMQRLALQTAHTYYHPSLAIIIPVKSVNETKQTIAHLASIYPQAHIIAAIDSHRLPKAASSLRHAAKKYSAGQVRVTARKNCDPYTIALQADTDLTSVMPETTRLSASFYQYAILPFSDPSYHAAIGQRIVRPGITIASGIETLAALWRHYMNQFTRTPASHNRRALLAAGALIRTQCSTEHHAIYQAPYSTHSIASHPTASQSYRALFNSIGITEFITAGASIVLGILFAFFSADKPLVGITIAASSAILAWWATAPSQRPFFSRITLVLVFPIYLIATLILVILRIVRSLLSISHFLSLRRGAIARN